MPEFVSNSLPDLPVSSVSECHGAAAPVGRLTRGFRRLGSAVAALALSLGMACVGMTVLPGLTTSAEAAVTVPRAARSWPVLRYNSTGIAVRYVQKRLHQTADGWFGPQTRRAVNTFNRNHHLKADGVVGRGTWAALRVPHWVKAGPHQWPVLRVKSYGPAVTYVKKRLHRNASTNWFGTGLANAVKQFKRHHHLRADAVVGKGVWKALGVAYRKPPAAEKNSNGIPTRVRSLNWSGLARCESGGNPRAVNAAGYYGLYQFSLRTWHAVGGSGNPVNAAPSTQTYRAQVLYIRAGSGQWPVCGPNLFR